MLYGGAKLALLVVRLLRGEQAETPLQRQDWPALATLTLLGGMVGPVATGTRQCSHRESAAGASPEPEPKRS